MTKTYYKAIRPDGTSFHDPEFRWLPEDGNIPEGGHVVTLGDGVMNPYGAETYLSVSVEPADCTGFSWPCKLLRVEPAGDVITPHSVRLFHKRAARSWRVVEELDPYRAFGPRGVEVAALIDEIKTLSPAAWAAAGAAAREAARKAALEAALDAAWAAAWEAARAAAWAAAREAARKAAREAAHIAARDISLWTISREAAAATIVRDLISPAQYAILMAPIEAARAVMRKEENDDTRDRADQIERGPDAAGS